MVATAHRRVWPWVAAILAPILGAVLVVAVTTGAPTREAVLTMLQRPARMTAAPVPVIPAYGGRASLTTGGVSYAVRLEPNRASAPNRLEITAAAGRRPLRNAKVTVVFSMPQMNMWHAFSLVLRPSGPGRYAAMMPFVGMRGNWRLDARVSGAQMRTSAFAVSDVLGS